MTGTAIVATGKVTVCCGDHIAGPGACCEPFDCGPCCPECPTCPAVTNWTPVQRRTEARAHRQFTADMIRCHRAASRAWTRYQQEIVDGPSADLDATPIYRDMIRQLVGGMS